MDERGGRGNGETISGGRHALVFGIFLALAFLWLLPGSLHPGAALLGYPGDNFQHAWFMWHFARAVSHGQNPFYTNLIFYPNRVNLAWSTTDPIASVLALPLTLAAGPTVAYNLCLVLQLALGGFFAYLLCLRICGTFAAALIGGVCFGLSPFLMGEALGHLSLVTAFPIPLYCLALDTLLRGTSGAWKGGIWCGLALFLTAMAHYNYTVFCVLLTMVIVAVDLALEGIALARRIWKPLAVAGVTFAALFLPFFLMMWRSAASRPQSRAFDLIEGHSADALGWFVPSWNHLLFGTFVRRLNLGLFGAGYEGITYLGPVISILAAIGIWRGWRANRRWAIRLLSGALVFEALSLGPRIRVWGRATGVPGPGFLFYLSPFARFISAPARFHVVAMLCFAALAAIGTAFLLERFAARRVAITAVIFGALALDLLTVPFPVATSAASVRHRGFGIPIDGCTMPADVSGTTVVTVPELKWPYAVRAMWMQVGDGGRYALADGYVSYGPDSIWSEFSSVRILRSLRSVQEGDLTTVDIAADRATVPDAIGGLNLGAVVVIDFPQRDAVVNYLRGVLGEGGERQATCTIFDVRSRLRQASAAGEGQELPVRELSALTLY